MAKQVPFHITAGLPFVKSIVVTLPAGRSWWPDGNNIEVLSQIREGPTVDSLLLIDIAQFMTMTFTAPNTLTIAFVMKGIDTRTLKKDGYYDVVLSDVNEDDDRAYRILKGQVFYDALITAATEVVVP